MFPALFRLREKRKTLLIWGNRFRQHKNSFLLRTQIPASRPVFSALRLEMPLFLQTRVRGPCGRLRQVTPHTRFILRRAAVWVALLTRAPALSSVRAGLSALTLRVLGDTIITSTQVLQV